MDNPRPLKIAYIAPDFDEYATSGGLYVIFEHCNALIRRGHSVRIFNDFGKDPEKLKLDCHVERHRYDTSVIDDWAPDVVVATHWPTFYFLQRLKSPQSAGAKLFYLIQSDERYVVNEELMPFYLKTITGRGAGGASVTKLAVSRYLQRMLLKDFEEDSVYIPNGIRIKDPAPVLAPSSSVRIIARYDPSRFRGWGVTNEVLSRIASARPDCAIHLFEMKKKRPAGYNSTFHLGYTGDKLLGLFKSCDIFLAANDREGFSYPMLEAMSQGACVCCTDAGGNMDFCIDGKTAMVARSGDVSGLYNNLLKLIDGSGLRKEISAAGRVKAGEFNWDRSIDRLEEAFFSAEPNRKIIFPDVEKDYRGAGNILMIWERDPFGDPAEWIVFDQAVRKAFKDSSRLKVFIKTDKHPMKSARAFLKMLLPKEISESIEPVILYHKRSPRLPESVALVLFRGIVHFRILLGLVFGERYRAILRYPES